MNIEAPDIDAVADIARRAGDVVMQVYATDFAVRAKGDASPVTEADERAEALIVPALRALAPGVPVVAEEMVARGESEATARAFWLVDPLDGTREFASRNGEFTVNIAFVVDGAPLLGVVLAPALGRIYGGVVGRGAWVDDGSGRVAIRVRPAPAEGLTVVASRSHGDTALLERYLSGMQVARVVEAGSSLKLCLLAAGEADLYPRFGRTMEWDIAAGHAVLAAAGGSVRTLDGGVLAYAKPGFENPHFVARAAHPSNEAATGR
jgi:3'(2'), 5'-bisphosphate nucleotidase